MVFIYHRLFKPSIYDFEIIPKQVRNLIFWIKKRMFPNIDIKNIKEAERPIVKTNSIPGPKGKGALNDVALFSLDYHNRSVFAHPEKSYLNFFVDPDGNTILDLNAVGQHLGYNHPALIKLSKTTQYELNTANPSTDNTYVLSKETLEGLSDVKSALKLGSLERYIPTDNTNETLFNLIINNPKYNRDGRRSVIARVGHERDLPFPGLKENESQEAFFTRALPFIQEFIEKNSSVLLGLILEPFTVCKSNGHLYITSTFAKEIKTLCQKHNIAFIVDESYSALNSGFKYGLEGWSLQSEPDYIVLRKASGINPGILTSIENAEYINLLSDVRLYTRDLYNSLCLLKYVKENHLLEKVQKNGEYVLNRLNESMKFNSTIFCNVRGVGTYQSLDFFREESRNGFVSLALNSGISLCSSGNKSITMRSALIVDSKHYTTLFNTLNNYSV